MARDGSGTYSLPATMATANAVASSTTVNTIMADIAQALTDSVNKDGSKAFAGAQSMGGNKLTNLAAGTAATDAARLAQVQTASVQQATTVGGTVDAITLAFTPAVTAYAAGQVIRWVSGGANTVVAPTVNCDGVGAKTIKKNPGGAALAAGDLGVSGTINMAVYDGTDFILLSPPANANMVAPSGTPAQGDVLYHNGSAWTRLAAGTDGYYLKTRGSGQNPEWAAVSVAASIPSGSVMPYAGATEPSGWLFCYGQAVSRTTYADLFAAISTTYGAGDGSTTFNLPDLRGRVVAGQDDMGGVSANRLTDQSGGLNGDTLGATGGAETHALTTSEMPAHTHSLTNISSNPSGGSSNYIGTIDATSETATTGSTGGGGAHNNVQPTIILNYIIKT